jgi:cell division protein FtsI/penicillin-binding protein 2
MEGMEAIVSILGLLIGIVLIIAQLRLFSIDGTLKAILAELQKQSSSTGAGSAPSVEATQVTEEQRARTADVQKNWPGYK